ncbi:carbohydrate-binding domain-containing protein [Ornithinibacillus xuwenensis]|uniref:Carbohydrate-binding domain-containing protein n=1 Tax=Ornithinibacillus xuwenensis TaxID=3144668 RepID=A0ABU9XGV0_9BACI
MKLTISSFIYPAILGISLIISGCSNDSSTAVQETQDIVKSLVSYDNDDFYSDWQEENVTYIQLEGTTAVVEGNNGVAVNGSQISIHATGTYIIEGTLNDGQIIVDAEDSGTVRLVLNGAEINSSTSAAIYAKQADKTVISIEEGTENKISDASNYVYDNTDEPSAAIYSKDDLTINGTGLLTVTGNYNDGITSRDRLIITGGTIEVKSVDDGIVGRDLFAMQHSNLSIVASGDGVKSSNDEDEDKGNIVLESGTLTILADGDGIQSEKEITIMDGEYKITTGGGSPETIETTSEFGNGFGGMGQFSNESRNDSTISIPGGGEPPAEFEGMPEGSEPPEGFEGMPNANEPPTNNQDTQETAQEANEESDDTISTKGIKTGTNLTIFAGTIMIDSLEDALHGDQNVNINGGEVNLSTGDDGIHADSNIVINNGTIAITKSLEGIEGANITIMDGTIHVNAADDGINVNGGSTSFEAPGMRDTSTSEDTATNQPEPSGETPEEASTLLIEGGYLYVNAEGDGLDSNSSIKMTGGTVLVYGPTQSMNGSLDYDQSFEIEGGILVAAGSSEMVQGISEESTQNAVIMSFTDFQEAGTSIYVEDDSGNQQLAIAPEKEYQSILISTPDLQNDKTYIFKAGGVLSGENLDGLYQSAGYSNGNLSLQFSLPNTMTYLNENGITDGQSNGMFDGSGRR